MKILLLGLLASSLSLAAPKAEKANKCLADSGLSNLKALSRVSMPYADKQKAMFTICDEMDDPAENESAEFAQIDPLWDQAISVVGAVFSGFYKEGIAALAETLEGSPAQRRYKAQLEMIKRIRDPHERVIRVFNLARASQGSYGPIINLIRNPGQIIDAAASGEVGGICREFAVLLAFSLRWVARPYGVQAPTFGGLGDHAFNATVVYSARHAWVRVSMAKMQNGRQVGIEQFDLDSTWHDVYSPLNPRRTGERRSSVGEKYKLCMRASSCLDNAVNARD
jgi:hypothetical protein